MQRGGDWLSPIQGLVQSPRPRLGNRELTFSMFFIFRSQSQLPLILVPFVAEFGQLLQNTKFFAKQVYSTLYLLLSGFQFQTHNYKTNRSIFIIILQSFPLRTRK